MKKYLKTVLILICMVLVLTCFTACVNQANEGNTSAGHPDSKPSIQNEISDSDEEQLEAAYQEQEIDPQQLKEYYDFISKTFRYMLAETENNNITYAPISFYVSLSILSEMTDKEAGKELQDAFGSFSDDPLHLMGIKQEASISIDEMGCSVASYTAASVQGSAPEQPEEVEICLNRPFYYILCKDEIPFLIGIIDNPAE